MTARKHPSKTREADFERGSEGIRQDIAKENESISQTVEQIGDRNIEKIDWREYVKDSPYWALGAAAGLGYLSSRMFIRSTTPMERIMRPIAEGVRDSLGGMLVGAAGSGLIRATLMGMATTAAANWIMNATSTAVASRGAGPRPQTGQGSTVSPRVESKKY